MPLAPTLIEIAIEPRRASDLPAVLQALAALPANDPALGYATDTDSGQIILGGQDEEQLDAAVASLQQRHGLELAIGAPQIAYRETLTRRVEMDVTHKKPVMGRYEFARVKIVFEPATGSSFASNLPQGAFPAEFVDGVARGIEIARRSGVLAGFPVVDVAATLADGAYHDTDSTPAAFETAAITAFRQAQKYASILLEPIMQVEIIAPDDYSGDLLVRRGEVGRPTPHSDGLVAVAAEVPLANLLGYRWQLRSLTRGTGRLTMAFGHFAPIVPPEPPDIPAAPAVRMAHPRPR